MDGPPLPEVCAKCNQIPGMRKKPPDLVLYAVKACECERTPPKSCSKCNKSPCECHKKVKIKLRDGKEREIQHTMQTSFWSADGKPISAEEFLHSLFGRLLNFSKMKLNFVKYVKSHNKKASLINWQKQVWNE